MKRKAVKHIRTTGEYHARIADRRALNRYQLKAKRFFEYTMKELISHYIRVERLKEYELLIKNVESIIISRKWIFRQIWNCNDDGR